MSRTSLRVFGLLRRPYSTASTPESAKKASIPLQVALRRTQTGTTDVNQDRARYDHLLAKGELLTDEGTTPTYEKWLDKVTSRRRRVRGTRTRTTESGTATEVVGQKIYLPNMIFRLMRNHTPPGQPYNPYEATFRIPRSVTKNDVRSYLSAVYGVQCTYIRTDNYIAPLKRELIDGHRIVKTRTGGTQTTYKRAVVGLVEPFMYPNAIEDMTEDERKTHKKWLEDMFAIEARKRHRKEKDQDINTGKQTKRAMTNRGQILDLVMKKRKEREQAVHAAAESLVHSGASPFGGGSLGAGGASKQT
ncbi:hypothetical protein FRB99_007474 [Tulasnella sp. 403]|nr:hypothetical protein FRB99_007474 [Tulasnella sp. 403]